MDETRIHPIWKEVAANINRKVELEGYGFLIEHEELLAMLEIKEPETIADVKKRDLEVLKKVEELKACLLYDYNLFMLNEFNKGYRVLEPDDQVTTGYEYHFNKARKKIHRAIETLQYVNHELLSDIGNQNLDRNLNKAVFVLSAFNKRRIPDRKVKAIGGINQ